MVKLPPAAELDARSGELPEVTVGRSSVTQTT